MVRELHRRLIVRGVMLIFCCVLVIGAFLASLISGGIAKASDYYVSQLSTGSGYGCVVANNKIYCWGSNGSGQLGDNSTNQSLVPVAVDMTGVLSGKTATDIATGNSHSCAVAGGKVYCWGQNFYGQLGNGTNSNSLVPVAVDMSGVLSGKVITDIAAGSFHTCVIASGQAYCWGLNSGGRLGNNSMFDSLVPVAVSTSGALSGKTVTGISAGTSHTCVIASSQAYCWGPNSSGQLGDGSNTNSIVPVAVNTAGVLSGKIVSSIAAGSSHSCAAAGDRAYCWGLNTNGQLGNGSTADSSVPVAVVDTGVLSDRAVSRVTAGEAHSCVVADDRAYCWGFNSNGRLGNGTTMQSLTPTAVSVAGVLSGKDVTGISAGSNYTCAVADNQAFCWGRNANGRLGNNSTTDSSLPVAVDESGIIIFPSIMQLGHRFYENNELLMPELPLADSNSSAILGGLDSKFRLRIGVTSGFDFSSVSADNLYTCATSNAGLYCWGSSGGFGYESPLGGIHPVMVGGSGDMPNEVSAISTVGSTTCAISAGRAYCWGSNGNGHLGDGSTTQSPIPVAVSTTGVLAGKTVTSISVGASHACAVANGGAYCWGMNSGRLGDGLMATRSLVPVAVSTTGVLAGKTVTSISAGSSHTCAVAESQAYCWGDGSGGVLGSSQLTSSSVPIASGSIAPDSSSPPIPLSKIKLVAEYAPLSTASCDIQTAGFQQISDSSLIAFSQNGGVSNNASTGILGRDPFATSSMVGQVYRSSGGIFANSAVISGSQVGIFDLSLRVNGAPSNTTYCIRLVDARGNSLAVSRSFPSIRTAPPELSVGFVDANGSTYVNPAFNFNDISVRSECQLATGVLGTLNSRLRVLNTTDSGGWTVSIAATGGPTAYWQKQGGGEGYDFNDDSGSPQGCNSGSDGDGLAGRLSVNPGDSTTTPKPGCSVFGISRGAAASFTQGTVNSITLLQSSAATPTDCYWDSTGVNLEQVVPAGQAGGVYSIDMTVTAVAS